MSNESFNKEIIFVIYDIKGRRVKKDIKTKMYEQYWDAVGEKWIDKVCGWLVGKGGGVRGCLMDLIIKKEETYE